MVFIYLYRSVVTKINPEITLTGIFLELKCFIESILKEDWYNKLGIVSRKIYFVSNFFS